MFSVYAEVGGDAKRRAYVVEVADVHVVAVVLSGGLEV